MRTQHREIVRRWALRGSALATMAGLMVLLGGCSIHEERNANGQSKKVDIATPFGSLHVNANDVDPKTVGIPIYPGSELVQNRGDNSGSANVNIDSSLFGLKVVALKYRTGDSPDKVMEFYRNKLKSYGNVLECKGQIGHTVGKPGQSRELTCSDDDLGKEIHIDTDSTQLKVGTTDRQHIVEVKAAGGGTEIGLVYLQTRGKGDSM
jgi:hypothetical protein